MKRSTYRILTTHTGNLSRPDDLVGLVEGRDQREVRNDRRFGDRVKAAVAEIVQKQIAASIGDMKPPSRTRAPCPPSARSLSRTFGSPRRLLYHNSALRPACPRWDDSPARRIALPRGNHP